MISFPFLIVIGDIVKKFYTKKNTKGILIAIILYLYWKYYNT